MKSNFYLIITFFFLVSGCVATSQKLNLLPEESSKAEVLEVLGKSYEVYYQAEDPNAKVTEVWDYRFFPYQGKYDRFKKSLDRNVGVVGSLGVALFYPPTDIGKETYRFYFKGDKLLKWEELSDQPPEFVIPRSEATDSSETKP